jgi:hypothetical protein
MHSDLKVSYLSVNIDKNCVCKKHTDLLQNVNYKHMYIIVECAVMEFACSL